MPVLWINIVYTVNFDNIGNVGNVDNIVFQKSFPKIFRKVFVKKTLDFFCKV